MIFTKKSSSTSKIRHFFTSTRIYFNIWGAEWLLLFFYFLIIFQFYSRCGKRLKHRWIKHFVDFNIELIGPKECSLIDLMKKKTKGIKTFFMRGIFCLRRQINRPTPSTTRRPTAKAQKVCNKPACSILFARRLKAHLRRRTSRA